MSKKPVVSYVVGKVEPVVFLKVFVALIVIIGGLALLGSFIMQRPLNSLVDYRFVLLPGCLAGGVAYITRHSTIRVSDVGRKKWGALMQAAVEVEGYRLKKDKDKAMTFLPGGSRILSLSQWMENMTISIRFKNHQMMLVGPRRIVRSIYEKMMTDKAFQELLEGTGAQ